jgi:hypothetical protein
VVDFDHVGVMAAVERVAAAAAVVVVVVVVVVVADFAVSVVVLLAAALLLLFLLFLRSWACCWSLKPFTCKINVEEKTTQKQLSAFWFSRVGFPPSIERAAICCSSTRWSVKDDL